MTFNAQTNAILIHEIATISLPWEGDNPVLHRSPAWSIRSRPLLKNPGFTSGTPILNK